MATDFPRLVSLACHDLRTPLATVQGFAKTLLRNEELDGTTTRWLGMIDAASDELVHLLDLLSLAARVEAGRYEPVFVESDSLELARAADPAATGRGSPIAVDRAAVERSLAALAHAARRHGGAEVGAIADGERIALEPIPPQAGPILLGEELKDLGAAVAVRVLRALGASIELEGQRLWVTLPSRGQQP